jgi:hypothetical protein
MSILFTDKLLIIMLKEDSDYMIATYSNAFFVCTDLCGLKKDDIAFAKAHILSRLSTDVNHDILNILEGIGALLDKDEINNYLDPMIKKIIYKDEKSLQTHCKKVITNEYNNMSASLKDHVIKRLQTWINFIQEKNQDGADSLLQLKTELECDDNIPF